jgi:chitodextrinase
MRTPGIINPRADTVAPTVPGSLAATALSTTSISLTWTASTDAVGVYGYQIWRGGIPRGTTTAGVLTYTDTGLTPTTTYEYRVSAYDEAGNMSGLSNIASATTQTPVTNLPPVWQTIAQQELTVGTGFSLNLTAYPSDPEGQPLTITQVSGTLPTGLTYSQSTKIVSGTPTAVEASSVSFRASDGVTSADRVIVFNVLAADATAPSVPTNLTATPSIGRIDLAWGASTDTAGTNERSSGMFQYRLFRDGLFRANINYPTLTYADINLPAGTTYSYTLRAVDVAGNLSALTDPTVASTPAPNLQRMHTGGHWGQMLAGTDTVSVAQTMLDATDPAGTPTAGPHTLKGFMWRYYWFEVETAQNVYSWTDLISKLQWCYDRGLKMSVMFVDRSFKAPVDSPNSGSDSINGANPLPTYLASNALYYYGALSEGYMSLRWKTTVVTRFKALLQNLYDTISVLPTYTAFEGWVHQESALGLDSWALDGKALSIVKATNTNPAVFTVAAADIKTFSQNQVATMSGLTGGNWAVRNGLSGLVSPTGLTITSATNADPAVFTSTAHPFITGQTAEFRSGAGGTWSTKNNTGGVVTKLTANTFSIAGLSGVGLGTLTSCQIWGGNHFTVAGVSGSGRGTLTSGVATTSDTGYSKEVYGAYYVDLFNWSGNVFDTRRATLMFNSAPEDGADTIFTTVVNACKGTGNNGTVEVGGPDCWPDSPGLVNGVYQKYDQHVNEVPLAIGMSVPSYEATGFTDQQIYEFARDDLHVEKIYWMRNGSNGIPVANANIIKANPIFNAHDWD